MVEKMKKEMILDNLKDLLAQKKIIVGSERTLKFAKNNKLKTIFLSKNTPENLKNEAKIIANALNIEVVELKENSKQIGTKFGKPFTILMFGILK